MTDKKPPSSAPFWANRQQDVALWSPKTLEGVAPSDKTQPDRSKINAQSIQPAAEKDQRAPSSDDEQSAEGLFFGAYLGPDSKTMGTLSLSGHLRLEGNVEGELMIGQDVVIAAPAVVSGRVSARNIFVLGGRVEATLQATGVVEIHAPAEVTGQVVAAQLQLEPGVEFYGQCQLTPQAPPVK